MINHTLCDQTVQVLVVWSLNAEVATADVVDGLVVDHEGAVRVLEGGVGGEDGVVGLDNGGGDLGGRVDAELELALLAVVGAEALEEKRAETGTGTATERVEDEETLERGAVVCVRVLAGASCWSRASDSPATRRIFSMTLSTISLPMV